MYKYILVILLFAHTLLAIDEFKNNCRSCHIKDTQLKMIMSKYTLKFSSKKRIENAMFNFLKNPSRKNSSMHLGFLNKFGIKDKTKLEDKELRKSIHQYNEKYSFTELIE
jgi:hypothetical protein